MCGVGKFCGNAYRKTESEGYIVSILICGGAGYIGSHINKLLSQKGYDTIVYDNLIYGHREAVK